MAKQDLTICKLIILYILRRIDFAMTFSQISDCVLINEYTDYFTLHTALGELTDTQMIHQEVIQEVIYYTITSEGEDTLRYFEHHISAAIKAEIDTYLSANQIRMRDESTVLADYYKLTTGEYQVRCRVKERDAQLIDLTLTVPSESAARLIAVQWKKRCQGVYAYLMNELMREDEKVQPEQPESQNS